MKKNKKELYFLEVIWDLGGSTVFNAKLKQILNRKFEYYVEGFSLKKSNLESGFLGNLIDFPIHFSEKNSLSRRSLIKNAYHVISKSKPNFLICTINFYNCEMIRHLPRQVVRVGVIHAVDDDVITMADRYASEFDAIVSVSQLGLEKLICRNDACSMRKLYIPPGILMPEANFKKLKNRLNPIRLLYLGRLTQPSKHARCIVDIAKALIKNNVEFEWTVAGDGDEKDYIVNEINAIGLHNVKIIGVIEHEKVKELFAQNDVIISTSEKEAFPLALQEAMSHGLVPIAAKAPGRVCEVVNEAEGYLVDVDDSVGFCRAIEQLAENRDLLEQLSHKAMNAITKDLSWESVGAKWHDLITALDKRTSDSEYSQWKKNTRIMYSLDPSSNVFIKILNEAGSIILQAIEFLNYDLSYRLKNYFSKIFSKYKH